MNKKKINIDITIENCRTLCKNVLKLSKINNPDLWKKYGKPHIAIWVELEKNKKLKKYIDSFKVSWADSIRNEHYVFFSMDDAQMNVKEFRVSKSLGPILTSKTKK